jgi:hypothetical protein
MPTASSHAKTTGAQSAVMIASGNPGVVVTDASATGRVDVGPAASTTSTPWTWSTHTHSLGSASPAAAATRCRLRTTETSSSPTCAPMLQDS